MKIDNELVALYVNEYRSEIEGFLPDLVGFTPDENDRDTITDFASDYIYNCENARNSIPEIRIAASQIAAHYC